MKWACVGCGQGVDYHGNPITGDEKRAWCYDCAERVERMTEKVGGARCRNCGNTGLDMFGTPCVCPIGKSLARLQADSGVEVVSEMADERLRCGDRVRVIGPAATSPGDTFAIGKETTVAELRTDGDGHTVYACQIRGWGFVAFPRASLERLDETTAQPAEPRAIVRAFARAMERKLAANDGVKGGWKHDNWTSLYAGLGIEKDELLDALTKRQKVLMALDGMMVEWENGQLLSRIDVAEDELLRMLDEANKAVLLEAADCANYLVMICDVCGALPATDERGR